MIAAPVGTRVDGFTVAPSCGLASGRYPLCLTHGNTFAESAALAVHLHKHGRSHTPCVVASLCGIHGPEEARKP